MLTLVANSSSLELKGDEAGVSVHWGGDSDVIRGVFWTDPNSPPVSMLGLPPLGTYRLARLVSMRDSEEPEIAKYGRFGIVAFDPCTGDAALAEAAGRFELWLHGAPVVRNQLMSTAGSLRLHDEDQQLIMRFLSRWMTSSARLSPTMRLRGSTVK
jgi:hypothetical protein